MLASCYLPRGHLPFSEHLLLIFAKPTIPSPVPSAWTSEPPTFSSALQAFPPQGSQRHPFYNKLDKVSLPAQSSLALHGSGAPQWLSWVPTGLPNPHPYCMELSCSTLTPLLTPRPVLPVNTPPSLFSGSFPLLPHLLLIFMYRSNIYSTQALV